MKQLAIAGKVIDISKISEKSEAQFGAQLKQNGIVLSEEELHEVYHQLHDEKEVPAEVQELKAKYEALAAAKKAEAEAKFNK